MCPCVHVCCGSVLFLCKMYVVCAFFAGNEEEEEGRFVSERESGTFPLLVFW